MDGNNDNTVIHESRSSSNEQRDNCEEKSERMKNIEDDFSLMRNHIHRNNRRIYSLFLRVMPDSELLSGLLKEDGKDHPPGLDEKFENKYAFEGIAEDLHFTDTKLVKDNYEQLKRSVENLHQQMKEKDQQLKSMRDELDEIKKSKVLLDSTAEDRFVSLGDDRDESTIHESRGNDQQQTMVCERGVGDYVISENELSIMRYVGNVDSNAPNDAELTNQARFHTQIQEGIDYHKLQRDSDVSNGTRFSHRTKFLLQNQEELEHHYLPKDTYSFLVVAKYFEGYLPTYDFSLAIFVLTVQLATLLIFTIEVTNPMSTNPLDIPADVESQVRGSQFIALLIACWNQSEIYESFNVLSRGYNEERVGAINPNATRLKWYFSAWIRIIVGVLSLIVTFMLILHSETVKDVMLDFAAVTFVSELDNSNFRLSLWGYMGKSSQTLTLKIMKTPIYETVPTRSRIKVPRFFFMVLIFCTFMIAWASLTAKQAMGAFVDQAIFVQFSDEFSPALGTFSGLYEIRVFSSVSDISIRYVELQRNSATFSYCIPDSRWIFQFGSDPERYDPGHFDPNCWSRARSLETDHLDITRSSEDTWFVFDEHLMLEMPLQHISISGRSSYYGMSCENESDCGERKYCEEETGTCDCMDGYFGLNCEHLDLCEILEIDTRYSNSGFYGTRSWSSRYSSMKESGKERPLQVYGKPVFLGDDVSEEGNFDVMIFTGRRWILTDSISIGDYYISSDASSRDFVEFLASDFHAYWSNFTFYFASEPVDAGTPTDSATPVGLQWFRMDTSDMRGVSLRSTNRTERIWKSTTSIDARLFCVVCNNETNPCFYGATCRSDGTCDCTTGSRGTLCEVQPGGDGTCDDYFNELEFSYDGGDCCQETCASSEENICGYGTIELSTGASGYEIVGYPNCRDPKYIHKLSGSTTLFNVKERGTVRCGSRQGAGFLDLTDGVYAGLAVDLCGAIAAAALGDPTAIEMIEVDERFVQLSNSQFDVLLDSSTFTAERDIYQSDAGMGFSFVPTPYFFDGLHYGGIPPFSICANNTDFRSPECLDLKICVPKDSSWLHVTETFFPSSAIVLVESIQAGVDGLEQGLCNVIAGETTKATDFFVRSMGFTGSTYELGTRVFSKEPLSAVTRQEDRVWSKFVSWIFEALIEAEESNVTRLNADQLSTVDVFGKEFQHIFQNAIAANGNYGEIYQKNLEGLFPRDGLNRINMGTSGLIYSFPMGVHETHGPDPSIRGSIDIIRRRGVLNCGITPTRGFSAFDNKTSTWQGLDVDMCRGIAAALLNGNPNVNFIPLTPSERFVALAEHVVDVMGWTTHTLTREVNESTTGEGFDFTPAIFYDGMGFGGHRAFLHCAEDLALSDLEVTSECTDTKICVPKGTTWVEAMVNQMNIPAEYILVTEDLDSVYEEFILGNCNVIAGESAQIAEWTVKEKGYRPSKDYVISERKFTKEPVAIASRSTDVQFSDFLRWVVFGFFYAAEEGITQENYFEMPISSLFGDSLSVMWQNAIHFAGNYNEMLERNFAGFLEVGGQNMLNDYNGPQFFAKPGVMID